MISRFNNTNCKSRNRLHGLNDPINTISDNQINNFGASQYDWYDDWDLGWNEYDEYLNPDYYDYIDYNNLGTDAEWSQTDIDNEFLNYLDSINSVPENTWENSIPVIDDSGMLINTDNLEPSFWDSAWETIKDIPGYVVDFPGQAIGIASDVVGGVTEGLTKITSGLVSSIGGIVKELAPLAQIATPVMMQYMKQDDLKKMQQVLNPAIQSLAQMKANVATTNPTQATQYDYLMKMLQQKQQEIGGFIGASNLEKYLPYAFGSVALIGLIWALKSKS